SQRLDAERSRLLECRGIDVQADHGVPRQEMQCQRSRAAAEVQDALSGPDRGDEERHTLGYEDEVALVAALAVVFLVALSERAHAEPTAASCPSDSMVLRSPSSSAISGFQPRICFARVMSGCRTCGSSTGSAS